MLRPEPTAFSSDCFFALREAAAFAKNLPGRLAVRAGARRILFGGRGEAVVNYGRLGPARAQGVPIGGEIKLLALRSRFPEQFSKCNLVYLVSSALPPFAEEVARAAKRLGAKLVWNQNGVAYPGCYGDSYPWFNRRMAALHASADYIIYQSRFSRSSAERYLGPARARSEILLNPVDLSVFRPADEPLPAEPWRILAAGTSHAFYRTKSVLDAVYELRRRGCPVRLTIAGEFRWRGASGEVARHIARLGIGDRLEILPPFRQDEAPGIYRGAHVLLHSKFNDPCPTVPIEAMACGLPVVGTRSGGMPELVPETAGVLVPVPPSWTEDIAGDPGDLADAVERVMGDHAGMARAARAHAERAFDGRRWLARHETVFSGLLEPGLPGEAG